MLFFWDSLIFFIHMLPHQDTRTSNICFRSVWNWHEKRRSMFNIDKYMKKKKNSCRLIFLSYESSFHVKFSMATFLFYHYTQKTRHTDDKQNVTVCRKKKSWKWYNFPLFLLVSCLSYTCQKISICEFFSYLTRMSVCL